MNKKLDEFLNINHEESIFDETVDEDAIDKNSTLLDPTTGVVISRAINPTPEEIAVEERIEDLQIDSDLQNIYDKALKAFTQQTELVEEVDPKFAARNAEVAAQYLSIALSATNTRINAKAKRLSKKTIAPNVVNNTLIVADRNSILREILNSNQIYEAE